VRVVRSVIGVLLGLLGAFICTVGGVAAFWLVGPDNTVYSGEQHLTSKGLAIASAPSLLDRHGPVLHVKARSSDGKPVFVGVARDFDAASYLKGFAHTELVRVSYPIALETQDVKGVARPLTAPGAIDWWVAKATGTGTQELTWTIADGPYSVVIMSADGKTAPDVQADLGIEIPNAFLTCLLVIAIGVVLLALGLFLMLFRGRRKVTPDPVFAAPGGWQAPPQPQQQPTQVGPYRRVAAATAVLALVSGCAAIPQPNTVATLTRPAIANDAAVAVIKHYNEVNNAANRRRDAKMLATVEGGNLIRQSEAGFTISRALDKTGKNLNKPFTYDNPVIGAPSFGSYPMRFLSSAEISGNKDYKHLGVWERKTAGSPWLLTFAAGPKATDKLPDLTDVRTATKADDKRLVAAPQAAATALAEYLTTGAKSPRAASFTPSKDVSEVLAYVAEAKADVARQPRYFRSVTQVFTAQPPAAFVTKSGAALVFATLTDEYVLTAQPNAWVNWSTGSVLAFSPPTVKYDNAATKTTLHDVALVIPPKGGGKIQILSLESQLIAAGGY
jgi:hypothetical protein